MNMNHISHSQLSVSEYTLATVPDRYRHDKHLIDQLAASFKEAVRTKMLVQWTKSEHTNSKDIRASVVILSVDEYKYLTDRLKALEEENKRMIHDRYSIYASGRNPF